MASPPYCIDELQWMGISLVSSANNHAADFGEAGILAGIEHTPAEFLNARKQGEAPQYTGGAVAGTGFART